MIASAVLVRIKKLAADTAAALEKSPPSAFDSWRLRLVHDDDLIEAIRRGDSTQAVNRTRGIVLRTIDDDSEDDDTKARALEGLRSLGIALEVVRTPRRRTP